MEFVPLTIGGAFLITSDRHEDDRGYFARAWCHREFRDAGLDIEFVQTSLSHNDAAGTLRGLHYQKPPHGETKLVRCVRGSMMDVILDLRPDSPTFCQHEKILLTDDGTRAVLVPNGCAHGFITLEEDTEVMYMISEYYVPEAAAGFRWNDPAFGIEWPREVAVISDRDNNYPDFQGA